MSKMLDDRAICFGNYILSNKTTIRQTAKYFGLSKSTVHNDLSKRLKCANFTLYKEVYKVLRQNFALKNIRGGEATRRKYKR